MRFNLRGPGRLELVSHVRLVRLPPSFGRPRLAVSHALLARVAAREVPSSLRLYRPGPTVAFGKLDTCGRATRTPAARPHASPPTARAAAAGGRCRAFTHARSHWALNIVYRSTIPSGHPRPLPSEGEPLARALATLGVERASGGEVPGEFYAGTYSVDARRGRADRTAQRLVRRGLCSAPRSSSATRRPRGLPDVYATLQPLGRLHGRHRRHPRPHHSTVGADRHRSLTAPRGDARPETLALAHRLDAPPNMKKRLGERGRALGSYGSGAAASWA